MVEEEVEVLYSCVGALYCTELPLGNNASVLHPWRCVVVRWGMG
jgi:hypothetical protein